MSSAINPERESAWRDIVTQAWKDEGFKQRLVDDPKKVLAEKGLDIPEGVNIVVVENESDRVHLVLPARPGNISVQGMPLTESDYDPGF